MVVVWLVVIHVLPVGCCSSGGSQQKLAVVRCSLCSYSIQELLSGLPSSYSFPISSVY